MSSKYLDEVRKEVAKIRDSLEFAHMAVELPPEKDDLAHAQAKARALKELQRATESLESLAAQLGDIPAPVRH